MSEEPKHGLYVLGSLAPDNFTETFDALHAVLDDAVALAMAQAAEPKAVELPDEFTVALWNLVVKVSLALAGFHDTTPRSILEEALQLVPDDERYREGMEESLERLRESDDD